MPITFMHINGEIWRYADDYGSKGAALNCAKQLRKQGWNARVVKRSIGWCVAKSLERRNHGEDTR